MKFYIGIDNGLKGGITVINNREGLVSSIPMPVKEGIYDLDSIINFIKNYPKKDTTIVLETAWVRPISGKRACFMNGFCYGNMLGVIETLKFKHIKVNPGKWMKDLGLSSKEKKGSIDFCLKRYPAISWKATDRCTTIHDGMTDSCCIAVWGKRSEEKDK